jgi:protein SCO1/2
MTRSWCHWVATTTGALAVLGLTACGGSDAALHGFVRDPAPNVADITLPDVSDGGTEFTLRADQDKLLVVYFGYTSCPDFCPTTMSDVKLARARQDDPERIDVAMVTVDPGRDLATDPDRCDGVILDCYVNSFVEGAHALGTDDPDALSRAAAPFGAGYQVSTNDDGEIIVDHTTFLYAVDDAGDVVMTWQFGTPIDDLESDFRQLLKASQG